MIALFFAAAFAATFDQIQARLAEIEPLRASRLERHAPRPSEDDIRKAASGTVAVHVSGYKAWATAVINLPIGKFWAGLNDELQHTELLGLGHIEIVQGTPCADRRHIMMLLPLPIVSDRWWVIENRYNTALAAQTHGRVRELTWTGQTDPAAAALSATARQKVADAVPVTFNHGGWLLIDLDGTHTLGEYFSWSDPGGELPAGPATAFASATIAKTMQAMADYARTQTSTCQ